MGLDPSGCGCIPASEYKDVGFNSGIFYKQFTTKYHTFNDVYKYIDFSDTIWYAKKYGIIKIHNAEKKKYELKTIN
jgi:hypothetical protein